jgi:negative regulator of replication initiation
LIYRKAISHFVTSNYPRTGVQEFFLRHFTIDTFAIEDIINMTKILDSVDVFQEYLCRKRIVSRLRYLNILKTMYSVRNNSHVYLNKPSPQK